MYYKFYAKPLTYDRGYHGDDPDERWALCDDTEDEYEEYEEIDEDEEYLPY